MDHTFAMRCANEAIDRFHELLVQEKYKDAQDYLEAKDTKDAIVLWFGNDTYQTLLEEMDEALTVSF